MPGELQDKNATSDCVDAVPPKLRETSECPQHNTKTECNDKEVPMKFLDIKISINGVSDLIDVQLTNHDTVQDIRQVILERPECCFRTCFSLHLNGTRLDDFMELHDVPNLNENSILKVIDEPYSIREARIHIRRLRDLLMTVIEKNAFSATDNHSLSYCSTITACDVEEEAFKRVQDPESYNAQNYNAETEVPPYYASLNQKSSTLLEPLLILNSSNYFVQCLIDMRYSAWNPPPSYRQLAGDLLYLEVRLLEDAENVIHITSSSNGFFVNRTNRDTYDPRANNEFHRCQTLAGLLSNLSPAFKKNLASIQKTTIKRHPLEVVASPHQIYPWLSPKFEHSQDPFRAEDAITNRIGYEEQIPGQLRDWNEELQSAKELPKNTQHQRILRDRALYKITCDFIAAATRGAQAVVNGNVMAINPGDEEKMRMYIWNNLFFSFACDSRDHYQKYGGDEAAYAAASLDLKGVEAYNKLDLEGLHTLGTVVVDYRGYRIIAQSIIPGILQREQENSVVYGSVDGGKTITTHQQILEKLKSASLPMKIRPHKVVNEKNEDVELCSSIECKGIIGADGRHYILDLFRTFPPDVNFLSVPKTNRTLINGEGIEKFGKDGKGFVYPTPHQQQLVSIRPVALEAFVAYKYVAFVKVIAIHKLQDESSKGRKKNQDRKIKMSPDESERPVNKDENGPTATLASEESILDAQCSMMNVVKPISMSEEQKHSPDDSNLNCSLPQVVNTLSLDDTGKIDNIEISLSKPSEESSTKMSSEQLVEPVPAASTEHPEDSLENKVKPEIQDEKMEEAAPSPSEEPVKPQGGEEDLSDVLAVQAAAKAVGSLSPLEFDIRFNPDAYEKEIILSKSEEDVDKLDKALIEDIAVFVTNTIIPKLVEDFSTLACCPIDGIGLTEIMHARGINMRYLGKMASMLAGRDHMGHIYKIVVKEMLLRSAKRQFKGCLQSANLRCLSSSISHFLNCLLGSFPSPVPNPPSEESNKKKKNKKKQSQKLPHLPSHDNVMWVSLSPGLLWISMISHMEKHFGFVMSASSIDEFSEMFGVHKLSILREFCRKTGVQLLHREYDFNDKKSVTFTDEDVLNIFPVVKYTTPKATDATAIYEVAQTRLQSGFFGEAHELMIEALNMFNQVYGPLHPDIVICYRALARIHYLADDAVQAISFQKKAVIVAERIFGIDHPETLVAYVHLALYCYHGGLVMQSLKLMYRSRYLTLVAYGEDHPDMATFDTNIGLMLHNQREFSLACKYLEHSKDMQLKYHGANSLHTATSHHLVARVLSALGNYKGALNNEKATYAIYEKHFGSEDTRTKESSEALNTILNQAVMLQKTLKDISEKGCVYPTKVNSLDSSEYDKKILTMVNKIEEVDEKGEPLKTKITKSSPKSKKGTECE